MSTPYQPYPQSAPAGATGTRGYLQGGPSNFGEAVQEAFKNVFTYTGRASRSSFWYFYLFTVVVNIVVRLIPGSAGTALGGLIGLVFFFTMLPLAARRLHDTDRSGYWLFLILLPIIGWIWLLVYYVLPGTPGPNKYDTQG